jgi:hypothetical protein
MKIPRYKSKIYVKILEKIHAGSQTRSGPDHMKSLIRIHNTGFAQVRTETEAIFMQIFPRQSAAFIVRILSP